MPETVAGDQLVEALDELRRDERADIIRAARGGHVINDASLALAVVAVARELERAKRGAPHSRYVALLNWWLYLWRDARRWRGF